MNHLTAVAASDRDFARARFLPAGDSDRRFRRAARHSRFIRIMRVTIPVGIVAGFAVLVVAVFFNPFKQVDATIDPGKLVVSGTKITMELPRLAGFTSDQKPYELTAQAAAQDLANPSVLELKELRAQVQTDDQGAITITAVNGLYDTKKDSLKLTENIVVRTGKGFEARLEEAVLDVKKGTIVSEAPVTVKLPNGTVDANRLDISDGGAVVRFSKGVLTNLRLEAPKDPAGLTASTPSPTPGPTPATAAVPVVNRAPTASAAARASAR